MRIKYNEEENLYTVDLEGAVILTNKVIERDQSMYECDCIADVRFENGTFYSPNDVTAWNMLFDRETKKTIKNAQ
jgi:hypothetical protein